MDIAILAAVIGSISALLGALIPTTFNYFIQREERKYKKEMNLLEKQKEVYQNYLEIQQLIMNSQNDIAAMNEYFSKLQLSVNEICLYGDDNTSVKVKSYFDKLVFGQQNNNPLTHEEHVKYQTDIVNGMRKNLNLSPFDKYEFIAFNPPK